MVGFISTSVKDMPYTGITKIHQGKHFGFDLLAIERRLHSLDLRATVAFKKENHNKVT